jgi:uncharacterized protein
MRGTNPARAPVLCAAAAFAAAVFGAAVLPGAVPARAQQPQAEQHAEPQARIVVSGEGSVPVAPDYAQIRGGVTTRGKAAKEATDANSKLMAAIIAALQDSGIEQKDIQTAEFSIAPIYAQPQPNSEAKLSGFRVSNQVDVKIRQLDKLGEVLDRLVGAGATDIGNIEFMHSDASKTLDRAREAAIADARRKAEIYARAADVSLGRIVSIAEAGYAPPGPMMAMRAAGAMAAVPIASGEDTLRVRITVGFDIAH